MNDMEKINIVIDYLDTYYSVENDVFINSSKEQEWGYDIIDYLPKILGLRAGLCVKGFDVWAEKNGIDRFKNDSAYNVKRLKTSFNPSIEQDLLYLDIDTKRGMMSDLCRQLSFELKTDIFDLFKDTINIEELEHLVKCVGYEISPTIYNQVTFAPRKYFQTIKRQEIENERQNNSYWKNWIRTRGQDKET